jgi:hypothetical protein
MALERDRPRALVQQAYTTLRPLPLALAFVCHLSSRHCFGNSRASATTRVLLKIAIGTPIAHGF